MRKSSILALLITFIGTALSSQVSASIDDVVKRYQQIYMWEQVATFCKGKAPTELQDDWELIESVLKYQGGYWGGKAINQLQYAGKTLPQIKGIFASLHSSSEVLAEHLISKAVCDSRDRDIVHKEVSADPTYRSAVYIITGQYP
jgi:hypothetical protein